MNDDRLPEWEDARKRYDSFQRFNGFELRFRDVLTICVKKQLGGYLVWQRASQQTHKLANEHGEASYGAAKEYALRQTYTALVYSLGIVTRALEREEERNRKEALDVAAISDALPPAEPPVK